MTKKIKYPLLLVLIAIIGWTSYEMLELPFWGYRPLFQFLASWLLIVLLIEHRWASFAQHKLCLALSCLSGLLLALGFPTSPLTPLLFIGFVPLLLIEELINRHRSGTSKKLLFFYCYNAFVIWNILSTFWVGNTAYVGGIVAIWVNSLFMAVPLVLFHQTRKIIQKDFSYLSFVAYWLAFEYLHLNWEISWPWLTLGNGFAQYPSWVQWYEYTGAFGGSLWILAINFLVFKWFLASRKTQDGNSTLVTNRLPFLIKGGWKEITKLSALIIGPILLSLFIYHTYEEQGEEVEVLVVQPNYEPHYDKFRIPRKQQLMRFLELSENNLTDNTEYLVFPETSLGMLDNKRLGKEPYTKALKRLVDQYPNLKLITGLSSQKQYAEGEPHSTAVRIHVDRNRGDTIYWELYNSAIQITSGEEEVPIYFKSKQVPGAEMMPYPKFFFFLKPLADKLGGSLSGHGKQAQRTAFKSDAGGVGPIICYESVFGEYTTGYVQQGANALFIITNDGWWDNTPGHLQHLQFASLRAIETRRDIARSANTGVSCFINQRGDIRQKTAYEVTTTVKGNIKMNEAITFYVIWGDVIGRIGVFVSLLLLLNTFVKGFLPNNAVT